MQHFDYFYHKFSFPIVRTVFELDELQHKQCVDYALNMPDSMQKNTNVQATMSSWWVWDDTDVCNPILDNILSTFVKLETDYGIPDKKTLSLAEAWLAVYRGEEFTQPHHHYPAQWSFVYYIQTSSSSSELVFCNRNSFDAVAAFKPRTFDLFLFPSFLKHYVPHQRIDDTRIVLAGNLKSILSPDRSFTFVE